MIVSDKPKANDIQMASIRVIFCAGYFPVFLLMLKLCKSLGKLLWQEPRYKGTKLFRKLQLAFEVSHIYNFTKGQIISEGNCGVLNFPKKQRNYSKDFCPSL